MKKMYLVPFCIAMSLSISACSTSSNQSGASTGVVTEAVTDVTTEGSSEEGAIADDSSDDENRYAAGTYKVGEDIPEGEYMVFNDSYVGYFEMTADTSGDFTSIIANGTFSYNSIVTISDGQYFTMTGCYAYPIESAPEIDITGDGMFKVGLHIPAGDYEIKIDDDSPLGLGYAEVTNSSTHVLEEIVFDENFEESTSVSVTDGQYLTLSDCHIVQ